MNYQLNWSHPKKFNMGIKIKTMTIKNHQVFNYSIRTLFIYVFVTLKCYQINMPVYIIINYFAFILIKTSSDAEFTHLTLCVSNYLRKKKEISLTHMLLFQDIFLF